MTPVPARTRPPGAWRRACAQVLAVAWLLPWGVAVGAATADRFTQTVPLTKGLVAVVAEGDLEARSMGSYTVRAYFDAEARAGNENTFYAAGLVRPRDGTVRSVSTLALPGRPRPLLMVVMQSAGSGGYLSAEAFAVEPRAVRLLASVRDLAPAEDPATHLRRRLGDPASATRQFLLAYQPLASAGVPKPAQLPALRPHLDATLRPLLEQVSTQQAASTCEGPPAIQGDLIDKVRPGQKIEVTGNLPAAVTPRCFLSRAAGRPSHLSVGLPVRAQPD